MKLLIMLAFMFTVLMMSYGILTKIFFAELEVNRRLKKYLYETDSKPIDSKKFNELLKIKFDREKFASRAPSFKKNLKIEDYLSRAGLKLKPVEFFSMQLMAGIVMSTAFYMIGNKNWVILIVGAIAGYAFPLFILKVKINKRQEEFNRRLPDMINIIIGSIRAGFSFMQSLATIVDEFEGPIKEEISIVLKEIQYGSEFEEALNHLFQRMPSGDLELLIQAVLIQRQVGGNLAEILEIIIKTIIDRNGVQRQVKTLTAQGKLSGTIVGILPMVLVLIIFVMTPEYIVEFYNDALGKKMIAAGIVFEVIGFVFIRKITRIEV